MKVMHGVATTWRAVITKQTNETWMINSNLIWEGVPLFGNRIFDYPILLPMQVICWPLMSFNLLFHGRGKLVRCLL